MDLSLITSPVWGPEVSVKPSGPMELLRHHSTGPVVLIPIIDDGKKRRVRSSMICVKIIVTCVERYANLDKWHYGTIIIWYQ